MMKIRLAIADDHPIVLDGLAQLFSLEPDFDVVARCHDGDEVIAAIQQHSPEVLVLDIRMPRKSGLQVLRELHRVQSSPRVVLLTAGLEEEEVYEAIRLGVKGLVLKEMAPKLLLQAVREVHAGREWLEKETVTRALGRLIARDGSRPSSLLTPRETEIVRMVSAGLRNKEIANRLTITEGTVKIHLHSIYEKLQVGGRLELSLYARDHGLIPR